MATPPLHALQGLDLDPGWNEGSTHEGGSLGLLTCLQWRLGHLSGPRSASLPLFSTKPW